MGAAANSNSLSPARKRLVRLMQDVNYGRITNLQVRDGDPVFDPPPTVLRLFLFGKGNRPNESRGNDGFALKMEVAQLFGIFERERNLLIHELIIDNGLPVRMTVADAMRA